MVDIAKTCETCSRNHVWNDPINPSLGGECLHGGVTRQINSSTTCRFYLTNADLLTILRLQLGAMEESSNEANLIAPVSDPSAA